MGMKSFLPKCKRVWAALKKPSKVEFWTTAKVAGVGIAVLGVLGFFVSLFMKIFV